MIAFFALAGQAISDGRSLTAYRMFTAAGLLPDRAWSLIDYWDWMMVSEVETGWTPEVSAMGVVINRVQGWERISWHALLERFCRASSSPS